MGQHILFRTSRILSHASENILLIDNLSTFIFQTKTRNQAFQLDNLSFYDLLTMLPFCVKLEDLACHGQNIKETIYSWSINNVTGNEICRGEHFDDFFVFVLS
jgi:hypothetical protein